MSKLKVCLKISFAVAVISAVASPLSIHAQANSQPASGIPGDWSHHHVIFSNPGTVDEARKNGKLDRWNKIIGDRRFQVQQLQKSLEQRQLAATTDYAKRLEILKEWEETLQEKNDKSSSKKVALKRDWSMNLGNNAKVGAGQYPAKFSFTAVSSCSDWIAFNTGVAGASGGQANIAAFTNIYDSPTCPTPNPSIYWSYFSGTGSALTSPVVSLDGSKIAYIENPATGAAVLRILAWHSGQGTPTAAATPNKAYTNTTAGAGANTAWNTTNCPTTGSCMISVAFQNGKQDKISEPFYVYDGTDTLYVGDASGNLHKFTGVFSGSPGEVTTAPWPIAVSSNVLTSPVYDSGTSGNIFVADSGGFLYSYNASTGVHQMTSSKLTLAAGTAGIADGPLVDSTTEQVYVFVGDDANTSTSGFTCTNTTGCAGVFQFAAGNTTIGTGACAATSATAWSGTNCGQEALFGQGTATTPTMYDGAFDHIYQVGTGTTGNLWVCAPHAASVPRLAVVAMQSNGGIVTAGQVIDFTKDVTTVISGLTSGQANCSPVTEIWGGAGTTNDYIYLSVSTLGTVPITSATATCTGACLYNFVIATGGTETTAGTLSIPTKAAAGIAVTGGSSGIVVDNTDNNTSESQIYYTPLSNMACPGNGSTGSGTGGCAIQTSQSLP